MNILNLIYASSWGGGEQYVYDICKQLKKMNIKSYVMVDFRKKFLIQRFSEVACVIPGNLSYFNGLVSINTLIQCIDKYNIEFINCHSGKLMPVCLLLKKIKSINVILFKHNVSAFKNDIYHSYLRKNVDAIVCVSKLVYKMQTQKIKKEEKKKYYLIYNGISIERFDKDKTTHKVHNDILILGYAGRISPGKGIDIIIDALPILIKKNKNIIFKIAGANENNYWDELKKYIQQKKLNKYVEYIGFQKDIKKFYETIDIFILPSTVKEAFGLVLCEAMYCKIPVITSNSGAQNEIIHNGYDGIIINDFNSQNLSEKIIELYNNSELRENMSNRAHIKVENNFTIELTTKKILNVYKNLMTQQKK